MQSSTEVFPLEDLQVVTPSGPLELLACLPQQPKLQQPLLLVHGSHGSAACFKALLPLVAQAGYLCYALSLRGHGRSWQPNSFAYHALTGISAYVADVEAFLDYLAIEHPDASPILVGHSMGGGVLQRALMMWETDAAQHTQRTTRRPAAGLVLLASAPLWGGAMDVARSWQTAEATLLKSQPRPRTQQAWLPWFYSLFTPKFDTGIDSPAQVRNKFFSPEVSEDVVLGWISDCKSRLESMRAAFDSIWPYAEPGPVLSAIDHDSNPVGRKILCISAEHDVLILGETSRRNFDAYYAVGQGEDEVLSTELRGSAHHIMLDVSHELCAKVIIAWLGGESIT
jgi:pimeloyl-ACP methyl ester carboxylesterase